MTGERFFTTHRAPVVANS